MANPLDPWYMRRFETNALWLAGVFVLGLAAGDLRHRAESVLFDEGMACYAATGDTLSCDGDSFRLSGLDAPAMTSFSGMLAKVQLDSFVVGREIGCESAGHSERGRELWTCEAEGEDVAAWMVANGFALGCARDAGSGYAELERQRAHTLLTRSEHCR